MSTTAVPLAAVSSPPSPGPWRRAARRFRRRPLGVAALVVLLAFVLVAILARTVAPYAADDEFLQFLGHPQPPLSPHHLLGTDAISHDYLSQLLVGIRETMISALTCAALSTLVGAVVGAIAGFYGGWFDLLVTWATTVVVAIPALAFLMIVIIWSRAPVSPLGYAFWLTAILWTGVARVVRASVVSLRSREYVEAAQALGAPGRRVLLRHVVPNAGGVVIVAATTIVAQTVVIVATIDYLGYGFNEYNRPTLGGLLADAARGTAATPGQFGAAPSTWWLYLFPAVLLVLLLVSVNYLGDTLDEALNPRTR